MRLRDWIRAKEWTYAEAAKAFGCSEIRVRQMCQSKPVRPGGLLASRIVARTDGLVKYTDLFIEPVVPDSERAA